MEVRLLHSWPFTNRHICFLSIVGLVTSQVLLRCPKSLPQLLLCWHSSWICWVNRCIRDRGCVFIHFKTVCTILWFAVLSLFSPCSSLISWSCILMGETCFSREKINQWALLLDKFPVLPLHILSQENHLTDWLTDSLTHSLTDTCRIWCMLPLLQILPVLENKILD